MNFLANDAQGVDQLAKYFSRYQSCPSDLAHPATQGLHPVSTEKGWRLLRSEFGNVMTPEKILTEVEKRRDLREIPVFYLDQLLHKLMVKGAKDNNNAMIDRIVDLWWRLGKAEEYVVALDKITAYIDRLAVLIGDMTGANPVRRQVMWDSLTKDRVAENGVVKNRVEEMILWLVDQGVSQGWVKKYSDAITQTQKVLKAEGYDVCVSSSTPTCPKNDVIVVTEVGAQVLKQEGCDAIGSSSTPSPPQVPPPKGGPPTPLSNVCRGSHIQRTENGTEGAQASTQDGSGSNIDSSYLPKGSVYQLPIAAPNNLCHSEVCVPEPCAVSLPGLRNNLLLPILSLCSHRDACAVRSLPCAVSLPGLRNNLLLPILSLCSHRDACAVRSLPCAVRSIQTQPCTTIVAEMNKTQARALEQVCTWSVVTPIPESLSTFSGLDVLYAGFWMLSFARRVMRLGDDNNLRVGL
jgi:hypothetical protein